MTLPRDDVRGARTARTPADRPPGDRVASRSRWRSSRSSVGSATRSRPTLLDKAPLLLLVCNPRLRNLVLVSPMVDFVPFVVVAVGRLVISDPLFYWFGRRYGDTRSAGWSAGSAGRGAGALGREAFRKAAWPVVALIPNNIICLLAGATGMAWPGVRDRQRHRHLRAHPGRALDRLRLLGADPRVQRHGSATTASSSPCSPSGSRSCCRPRRAARPRPDRDTRRAGRGARGRGARTACTRGGVKNVLGSDLEPCGFEPLTGFYRDGCCNTGGDDPGVHVVCARDDGRVPRVLAGAGQRPVDAGARSRFPRSRSPAIAGACARRAGRTPSRPASRRPCTSMRPTSRPSSGARSTRLRRHAVDRPEP